MDCNNNFNLMTLAKYWPDLTEEERRSLLNQCRLDEALGGIPLSSGNFKIVARTLETAGVGSEDERWALLVALVCETVEGRTPRCPSCGCSLIVVPDEGNFCSNCEWFEGHDNVQGQLDDAWR